MSVALAGPDERIPVAPAVRGRVLQIVTRDNLGGVRTLTQMIASDLAAEGYEVETVALRRGDADSEVKFGLGRVLRAVFFGQHEAIFTYQAAASIYGNLLGWLSGVPLRVAHQTAAPEGIRPHWRWLDRLCGRLGIYTHIVTNSAATAAAFSAWPQAYRQRFLGIPHGVEPLPAARGDVDWRRSRGIPQGAPVLIATGRLVAQKSFDTAIRALPLLADAHLLVAGNGPDAAALAELGRQLGVASRLHLLGGVARDDLGDVLAAGNIYLMPSVWETFGLAGVEASMAGLPIAASDLPVLREVLTWAERPAESGRLVRFHPLRDAAGLAKAVAAMLDDYPSDVDRGAWAAAQAARHGRRGMIERYVALLERKGPLR
jgi:glycosyltransferase involved in cell wall biosynthesis